MLEGAAVSEMISFIQLTIFFIAFSLVVDRQTSAVLYTPAVALNWVQGDRVVKNMANKLGVLHGISMHIKGNLLAASY